MEVGSSFGPGSARFLDSGERVELGLEPEVVLAFPGRGAEDPGGGPLLIGLG